jgi:hypothetical protein
MTHITATQNYLFDPINGFLDLTKSVMRNIHYAATKTKRDREIYRIAELLHRHEYRNESFYHVLTMVERASS